VVRESPDARDHEILKGILPHVQERVALLGEVPPMVAFLFTSDDGLVIADDARSTLGDQAGAVLDAALAALEPLEDWATATLEATLREALVESLGVSPRHAFGPVRVGISGARVSPPLFESMEVLGKASSLQRLRALRATL
jgi:glutamyl-tRNA synthetase